MIVQTPAEGIMKTNDWGDSRVYRISCTCGQPDHDHNVWVEADDSEVSVTIYTTVSSNFWSRTRWHAIWTLLTKGYIDTEATVIMRKQQAYNYAQTLLSAVEDVEAFRNDRQNRAERVKVTKLAEQGDCE
jgi:hypothetical protein